MRLPATQSLRSAASLSRQRAAVAVVPRAAFSQTHSRSDSQPPPAEKASGVIAALPGNNIVSKTGFAFLTTGALATAISQELYVVNDETLVLVGFLAIATYIARSMKAPYKEWADARIGHIKNLLNSTRQEHTQAVADRITSVQGMRDVVDVTKNLFALSKETAKLEADAFTLKQQVAVAAEVKSVLDSWVRFEQQQKESEQAELAKSVIDKVLKSLQDEKTQKDILQNAVAEIEQLVKSKAI